jgi:LPXTG-motif cell wall-anchored protein
MTAAPRSAARVLFAGVLTLLALPLAAGPAAADPTDPPASVSSSASAPKAPAPPAPPGPGTVTATATVDCDQQLVVVTGKNTTGAPVTLGAFLFAAQVPVATLDVPANGTATTEVDAGDGPFELTVRRLDTSAAVATADGSFPCPVKKDLAIEVYSGETYTSDDVCGAALFLGALKAAHGTATTNDRGFTYTSVAGYTGPDAFDYECTGGDGIFGTVKVTVLPAAETSPPPTAGPSPAAPPTAAPGLPATGTDHLPVLLGVGAGLVAAGALVLRVSRR